MKISDRIHAFIWQSMYENNSNTYLINGTKKILIDPGHVHLFDHVRGEMDALGIELEDIDLVICTHAHPDHFEAVQLFRDTAQFAIHATDWSALQEMARRLGMRGNLEKADISPDIFLEEGEFQYGDTAFSVFHTPGHSPGSVSLLETKSSVLFTGDVIFNDALGRTDLPGGNGEQLKESIRRLAELNAEWLLSGHGDPVAGVDNVRKNFANVEKFWFRYI